MSWEEDAAFRRLLDTYYTTEKALPVELRAVFRLVLATTESQREAVQQVLNEFFELTSVGWINARADKEINAMRDKQAMNENRDVHEKERMRRHRDRRAEMFSALREFGIIPAWDVTIKELQRLYDQHCNAPATHLQREQVVSVNAPATAIPTPTPTPIYIEAKASLSASPPPDCPHEKLIDLFGQTLPNLAQPRKSLWRQGKNAPALKARWRWVLTAKHESGKREGQPIAAGVEDAFKWFERFFEYVAKSDFLTGKSSNWACDLGWLVNQSNFEKVLSGVYENKEVAA